MKKPAGTITTRTGHVKVATRVDGHLLRGNNYPPGYVKLYGGEHRRNARDGINKGFGDGITDRQGNRQDGVWED